jgi:hypothetical protein
VNQGTQCDLDRLNKWVQGRSLSRSASVYADFAAVIETARPSLWITDYSLEEFAAELADRTGADAATLVAQDIAALRGNPHIIRSRSMEAFTKPAYSARINARRNQAVEYRGFTTNLLLPAPLPDD